MSSFLDGGGELGALMRAYDWAGTPLGPAAAWPESLRSTLGLCLNSAFPIAIYWGPQLALLYNDAWRPILGEKHPWALSRPAREVWPEIWESIDPVFAQVRATGKGVFNGDSLLAMNRYGYVEECYFDYTFNPIRSGPGIGGIFNVVIETTYRVVGERRARVQRDFAARLADATSTDEVLAFAAATLAESRADIPFALLYHLSADGGHARLAHAVGVEAGTAAAPLDVALDAAAGWPFGEVARGGQPRHITGLAERFGPLPGGVWPEAAREALVLPVATGGSGAPAALFVAGVSPRRAFNDDYQVFFQSLATHMSSSLSRAEAFESQRKRAEALAELDRAKTAFFSNVSHEFRTPLTLMLGPLDEVLSKPPGGVLAENRPLLEVVQRNGLRLLKLVNTLLDFARIEAGRTQASYEPTDLAALTSELASNFRSACERAGLALEVDCPPLAEAAYVDREMWEKIVLNLLSNAFKFTLQGGISVSVRENGNVFELLVSDTGAGIPAEELSRTFERFHRVEGVRGRSHEGSGIGLALVQELVKLHGGSIEVESELGSGTTFTVRIPRGAAHFPADRICAARGASTAVRADAYVDEALSWLPGTQSAEAPRSGARILLADDNTDLREYARRLLLEDYEVEAVPDGIAALAAARAHPPALVVSDVMMPGLDGFGLIRELRADPKLRSVPIILLSARAGEEARIEGLGKGADDYLVKPFSGRELQVRVATLLRTAELRRQALEEQRRLYEESRRLVERLSEADRRKDEFLATLSHELRNPLAPLRNAVQLLRMRESADPAAAPIHQIMDRQVDHLVRLVDDLLEVSRISRGTFELRRERVELATVVRNAVDTSNPLIHAAGHQLTVSVPREALWLDGDPVRLAQILANLLNNAATYTEHGGRISVRAWREDGNVLIAVRDNGPGIAGDALPRMFEMFHRGSASSRRNPGGLGIGLSLARGLAEMHGGTIGVKSEGPGQGAEFTVRLPLAAAEPAVAADRAPDDTLPSRRILVVDDNRDAADSLGLLLKVLGADVRVARDGAEALEAYSDYDPAVVLLDIGMPGMDGYEVARRIRARSPGPRPTIVALTGWGQEKDRNEAREAGFDHHLVKPAELGALKELLRSIPA